MNQLPDPPDNDQGTNDNRPSSDIGDTDTPSQDSIPADDSTQPNTSSVLPDEEEDQQPAAASGGITLREDENEE